MMCIFCLLQMMSCDCPVLVLLSPQSGNLSLNYHLFMKSKSKALCQIRCLVFWLNWTYKLYCMFNSNLFMLLKCLNQRVFEKKDSYTVLLTEPMRTFFWETQYVLKCCNVIGSRPCQMLSRPENIEFYDKIV